MGSRRVVLLVVHAQMHAGRPDVLTSSSAKWWVSVVLSVLRVWVFSFRVSFQAGFVVAVEERGECFCGFVLFFYFFIFGI